MLTLHSFGNCLADPKYPQDLNGTVDTKQLWVDWANLINGTTAIDPDLTEFDLTNVIERFVGKPCPLFTFTYRGKNYSIADIGGGDVLVNSDFEHDVEAICEFMDIIYEPDNGGMDIPAQYLSEVFTGIEALSGGS